MPGVSGLMLCCLPKFLQGPTVDDLVASGDLDEATGRIFRFGSEPLRFHRHQAQSIAKAQAGQSYVVTTGTGSGKSLCFFVPVVDAIVRARKAGRPRRTSAIFVYPMNALANSQINEIEKFIAQSGLPTGPWYLGLDHHGVVRELSLSPADVPGPGYVRFAFGTLGALYGMLHRAYELGISLPDAPLREFELHVADLPRTTEAERLVVERIDGHFSRSPDELLAGTLPPHRNRRHGSPARIAHYPLGGV